MLAPGGRKACQVLASGQEQLTQGAHPCGAQRGEPNKEKGNTALHMTLAKLHTFMSLPWPLTSSVSSLQPTINLTRLQMQTCCGRAAPAATLDGDSAASLKVTTPCALSSIYGSQVG